VLKQISPCTITNTGQMLLISDGIVKMQWGTLHCHSEKCTIAPQMLTLC